MGTVAMHMGTPERSLEQRLAALENANQIRIKRAKLKRQLKRREVGLLEVLAPPAEVDPMFASMKVRELLLAAPKFGHVKTNKVMARAHMSPSKTLAGMTSRQHAELLAVLHRYGPAGIVR